MPTWEEKFIRYVAERWVFQGSDPHEFTPRTLVLAFGEDFLCPPLLEKHRHFGSLYSGYIGGCEVGYIRVPPGTVILEGVMRCLKFTRVDTVIGLGTCGALQPEINCGDIVAADSARAGDCLSAHYGFGLDQMVPADSRLTARLSGFLKRRGLPVHTGPIVTTGAAFRETGELINSWSEGGFLGVELEASSLFALADFLGIRTAIALLVTDSPVRMETSDIIRSPKRKTFVEGMANFIGTL